MQKLCVIFKKAVSLPLVIITSNLLSHRASLCISYSGGRVGDASINLITEINRNMKTLANIVWLVCGGLEAAFGYFTGSLALAITIIGIPFAMQAFKIGLPLPLAVWCQSHSHGKPHWLPPRFYEFHLVHVWRYLCLANARIFRIVPLYYHYWHPLGQAAFQDGWAGPCAVWQRR